MSGRFTTSWVVKRMIAYL
jgi:hypothetical protein